MELKKLMRETWNFIWKDDSAWGWIVSLILAFIIVKFIFFPLISFALATKLPLVVIESGSMHHSGGFFGNTIGLQKNFELWWEEKGEWYIERNITKELARKWKFKTGMEAGDIIVVYGRNKNLEIGDVIIFNANSQHPIIHRIIKIEELNNEKIYSTKGDNNAEQLLNEKEIREKAIVGKAIFKIPKLGWLKLGAVKIIDLFLRRRG